MPLREALTRDERVFLMGEDVGRYGGSYACSMGLLEEFGPIRVGGTPISEQAILGGAMGAALRVEHTVPPAGGLGALTDPDA